MASESGPENLGDILGKLFTARGWGRQTERVRLETAWADTVDANMRPDTRVLSLKRGVLEIEVRTGVLLQELAQFHKRRLLTELRKKLTGTAVTDLKFKSGTW
jgi:predicted nucleic acid-binding Zn ribbon protein